MKLSTVLPLLAILSGTYASSEASLVEARACKDKPLVNGDFETGSLSPWTVSAEYESVSRAAKISTNAFMGKYATKLTLVYDPSDKPERHAPLVDFGQDVRFCSSPGRVLTVYYKILPNPQYDNSFLTQLYDSVSKKVYVYDYITFNDTANVDSLGNAYGKWHTRQFYFQPSSALLVFSFILDGDYHGYNGTSSVLVDSVSFVLPPGGPPPPPAAAH